MRMISLGKYCLKLSKVGLSRGRATLIWNSAFNVCPYDGDVDDGDGDCDDDGRDDELEDVCDDDADDVVWEEMDGEVDWGDGDGDDGDGDDECGPHDVVDGSQWFRTELQSAFVCI